MTIAPSDIPLDFRIYFALACAVAIVIGTLLVSLVLRKQPKPSDTYTVVIALASTPIIEKLLHGQFIPAMAIQSAVLVAATVFLTQALRLCRKRGIQTPTNCQRP
jgi:type II secretory pathway component PulF